MISGMMWNMTVSEYEHFCNELRLLRDQRLFTLDATTLENFHPWEHHAILSEKAHDLAIVPRKTWKQYTQRVRQSSLTNQQKESLVWWVANLPRVREELNDLLMAHPLMAPAITEWTTIQDTQFASIQESVIRNSEVEKKTSLPHTLQTVTVNGAPYFITVESLKQLRYKLDDKALLAQKKKGMPFLVGSAFEAWSDERAAYFFESFNPQRGFAPEDVLPEFWEQVAEYELDVESNLRRFEHDFHVMLKHPETGEVYFLFKHHYNDILKNCNHKYFRKVLHIDELRQITDSYIIDSYAFLLPYLVQEPHWGEAGSLLNNIGKLHDNLLRDASTEHNNARKVDESAFVSEGVYQEFINTVFNLHGNLEQFYQPNDYFLSNYVGYTVSSMLHKTLRYANRKFVHETEGRNIRNSEYHNGGKLLVPTSELSMEQLVEFYVCGRKNKYQSAVDAFVGLIALRGKPESQVYSCDYCEGYHYGVRGEHNKTLNQIAFSGEELYPQEVWRANRFFLGREALSLAA
jgi:hypothetical protein